MFGMDERKITLTDEDGTLEFYVIEETRLNGRNYLLVSDSEEDEDEGDCYLLKDLSDASETEAVYEFVEDENELEAVMKVFEELLEDVQIRRE